MQYENMVKREVKVWEFQMLKPPGFLQETSKKLSKKVNEWIPDKVHQALTAAVKGIVKTVLAGVEFSPKGQVQLNLSLKEMDVKADHLISIYKKIASAEGAGTGAGGIVLGIVDFPALIAIKMKFLFELAHVYGYDTNQVHERLYLLYIFQLAFSGEEHRRKIYASMKHWPQTIEQWPKGQDYLQSINWEKLQQEYRDSIDFRKMLQMIPGLGAVIGAWANYGLLDELGSFGKNSFRIRKLSAELDH